MVWELQLKIGTFSQPVRRKFNKLRIDRWCGTELRKWPGTRGFWDLDTFPEFGIWEGGGNVDDISNHARRTRARASWLMHVYEQVQWQSWHVLQLQNVIQMFQTKFIQNIILEIWSFRLYDQFFLGPWLVKIRFDLTSGKKSPFEPSAIRLQRFPYLHLWLPGRWGKGRARAGVPASPSPTCRAGGTAVGCPRAQQVSAFLPDMFLITGCKASIRWGWSDLQIARIRAQEKDRERGGGGGILSHRNATSKSELRARCSFLETDSHSQDNKYCVEHTISTRQNANLTCCGDFLEITPSQTSVIKLLT